MIHINCLERKGVLVEDKKRYISVTHAEQLTGISKPTIRRYIQDFSDFIDIKTQGKEYRINVNSLDLLKKIYYLSTEQKLRKDDIYNRLASEGVPITITLNPEDEKSLVSVNDEIETLKKMLIYSNTNQDKLISEIKELKKKIKEMQEIEKQEDKKRDEQLTRVMKEMLETRKEIATIKDDLKHKKWWQFWK
jgi:hypothetical protein